MEITTFDTLAAMRAVLDAPVSERKAVYRERLIEPLRECWEVSVKRFNPQAPADETMAMKMLWDVDLTADLSEQRHALERLEQANAWQRAEEALHLAARTFEATGRSCAETHITNLIFLGNPRDRIFMELNRGYAGAQLPGYVILPIWPNDYNLPRLPSAIVHEFNHRVRLTHEPWTFATTVGQYIVLEGLAESFAAELYGPELVGPWVSSLSEEEVANSRAIIGAALHTSGFDKIRAYIFGDQISGQSLGLPHCAGYTIGYQIVQSYLQRTGKSAVAATFVPWEEIIAESDFFTRA